jgi:hypothetical protein
MRNPGIQNDFSYYRRTLSRLKLSDPVRTLAPSVCVCMSVCVCVSMRLTVSLALQQDLLANLVVRDELANKMSFFLAVPTPMLNAVVGATTSFAGAVRGRVFPVTGRGCRRVADPTDHIEKRAARERA